MISDLTADRDARDRGQPADAARDERLADALRVESLTDAFRPGDDESVDRGRRRRALLDAALFRTTAEIDRERARAVPWLTDPDRDDGLESDDPGRRTAVWNRGREAVDRARPFDEASAEAIDELGQRAGQSHGGALLAATEPTRPCRWLETIERDVLSPGDDPMRAAARARASDVGVRGGHGPDGARALGELDGGRGRRPLPLGPLWRDLAPRWGVEGGGPEDPGPGPGAMREALERLGRDARAAFLSGLGRRDVALWADPAFEHAAGALFRRLCLTSPGAVGLPENPATHGRVRLEEARIARVWATRLAVGTRAGIDACRAAERRRASEADAAYVRAVGWPAGVGELERARCVRHPASALRGLAYAALLEERLLTRWGRDWVRERAAGAWLREAWEGESHEDTESMARHLDVGTIEGPVIWDAYRPPA